MTGTIAYECELKVQDYRIRSLARQSNAKMGVCAADALWHLIRQISASNGPEAADHHILPWLGSGKLGSEEEGRQVLTSRVQCYET